MDEESLAYLGEIGEETSLRHAVQLMTPAMVLARTAGRWEAVAVGGFLATRVGVNAVRLRCRVCVCPELWSTAWRRLLRLAD